MQTVSDKCRKKLQVNKNFGVRYGKPEQTTHKNTLASVEKALEQAKTT